jgi:hypothetical protein
MNIALQLELTIGNSVISGDNVPFDNIMFRDGDILYDPATGVITFNESGRYIIQWWVAQQASASISGAAFAISSSQGDLIEGNSPSKTAEVVGMGIVNVATPPVTCSLLNIGTSTAYYSAAVPIKSMLTVMQDDIVNGIVPAYGTFYNITTGTVIPPTGTILLTQTQSPVVGMSLANNVVTVNEAGTYLIDYVVYASGAPVALRIDGSTIISSMTQPPSGTYVASIIIDIVAGGAVSLINATSIPTFSLTLKSPVIVSDFNAQLRLLRIA